MQSLGAVRNTGNIQSTPSARSASGKFNAKLISGLKKNGNGVVVKVPSGVKGVTIRSLRSVSTAKTNLAKANSVQISFNNSSKDNFVALRVDKEGNIHASVIEDIPAEYELGSKMRRSGSDVGIINGKDARLNEKAGLSIREALTGNLSGGKVRFLSAVQLTRVSSRLQGLFDKFRSMRSKSAKSRMGVVTAFKAKIKRRRDDPEKRRQPHKKRQLKQVDEEVSEESLKEESKEEQIDMAVTKLRKKIDEARKNKAGLVP